MSTIRLLEQHHQRLHSHLFSTPGEHFAFMLAEHTRSRHEPVFIVKDIYCVPDEDATFGDDGWVVSPDGYLRAINRAVREDLALIEAHNHGGERPRFSRTDRRGFEDFVPYVMSSLPNRPYGVTVWGDTLVYGEFFDTPASSGTITSIASSGTRFRQVISADSTASADLTFDRQLPWFTPDGQRMLKHVEVGIVGAGGTGSQLIQSLAYLGIRRFVIVDPDDCDTTSMNRLVTATPADLHTPKVILARRLVRSIAPDATVHAVGSDLRSPEALDALRGIDVAFGCIDNDGARLILTELTQAYGIPYFDLGVGIEAEGGLVEAAGGRVIAAVPGGPCLTCMDAIDSVEARFFLSDRAEQEFQLQRGYVRGLDVPAPAVVSLNAAVAAIAVNEFAVYLSGLRPVHPYTEYDLLGAGQALKSQWVTPRRPKSRPGCVHCAVARRGDRASVERYAIA